MSDTASDKIPTADTPATSDWETWLYVACGVGGVLILTLVAVIIYLAVRAKKRSKKIKAQQNARHDNEAYVEEEDDLRDVVFVDTQLQPQIAVQTQQLVTQPNPQGNEMFVGDKRSKFGGAGHQVQADSNTDSPMTSQWKDPRGIEYDDRLESGPVGPSKKQHQRSQAGHLHSHSNGGLAPQSRGAEDLFYHGKRPVRSNGGRGEGHLQGQRPSYEEEMRVYRHSGQKRRSRYREDGETSSVIIPRAGLSQKEPKKSSSIPDLAMIRETEGDFPAGNSNAFRNWPRGVEQGWSYLKPMGLDRNFSVDSSAQNGARDRERPLHRPVGREISAGGEEFAKRKTFIEDRAIRAASNVDGYHGKMPQSRRPLSPDDHNEGASGFVRGGHRNSTSLSPNRYPRYQSRLD